ncbi:hypothetical protein C7S14_6447 [Burkholderia cepacia]|nr:hypothetical protein [Burkholderia cepacia]MDW9229385.1 hypothetical protein [Burkholderia cepacia]QOH32774.1 hypothetical protein C7S14_6447 [Burkholderia cepacia]
MERWPGTGTPARERPGGRNGCGANGDACVGAMDARAFIAAPAVAVDE